MTPLFALNAQVDKKNVWWFLPGQRQLIRCYQSDKYLIIFPKVFSIISDRTDGSTTDYLPFFHRWKVKGWKSTASSCHAIIWTLQYFQVISPIYDTTASNLVWCTVNLGQSNTTCVFNHINPSWAVWRIISVPDNTACSGALSRHSVPSFLQFSLFVSTVTQTGAT